MSGAASSAPSGVVRSHTTSHRYRPSTGEHPQRARSSAARPSHHPSSHSRSNSRTYSRDDHDVGRHSTSRRSASRDRTNEPPPPAYPGDPSRSHRRSSSKHGYSRNNSDMTAKPSGADRDRQSSSHSASHPPPNGAGLGANPKRRTTISTPTGQWALGKTIGAGSMGKVKLAKNLETGEQAAVKIIPRHSTEEHRNNRESERADRSKEIRTAREAAIVTLLNHPYVCGMKDVVRTNYHWYMLFEYVNGGQMLDYIISHGKLKEKQARKFARQIASALDYCHRNNIVHRDLKIENILISKTGDIKIIDFGLSNLYSPKSQLKTFCGSLYFAAPELLQARQYIGPEVDVWSFGIVLYVLVCGKVPFDDQSMSQLHAKIKKGVVEYPPGLSSDCRHIISRMLVTDPKQRAGLGEILNHPWMTKSFSGPPDNFLPHREPVQLPLDGDIVRKMTGFEFGPPEFISTQLTQVIDSEGYQNAVRQFQKEQSTPNPSNEKKRGVFDFYKRRNSASKDNLSNPSTEVVHALGDPVQGYNPLVSIYHLVREKIDRERQDEKPGALSLHQPVGEPPAKVPNVSAPEAAHTGQSAYEYAGENDTRGRTRPRARTHGDEDIIEDVKNMHLGKSNAHTSPNTGTTPTIGPPPKKENVAVGLLRRLSTRKPREKEKEKAPTSHGQTLNVPGEDTPSPRRSFNLRHSGRGDASPTTPQWTEGRHPQEESSQSARSHESPTRPNKLLGRSTSVNSADYRTRRSGRRGGPDILSSSIPHDPSLTSDSERSGLNVQKGRASDQVTFESKPGQRVSSLRTKSLGHARHESIQARRARREEAKRTNVPEETDAELADANDVGGQANTGDEFFKPVYLKGLFSVSTTSSKPLQFIRADIIRVLKQLGVEYTEIRGGFSCRHAPSIDLSRVVEPPSPERQGNVGHRRKISFGGLRGHDKEETKEEGRPSHSSRTPRRQQGPPDQSFVTGSEGSDEYEQPRESGAGDRVIGETTTRVQSDRGENLVMKFEILIVKVPLFSLHGIQFKKVSGGMWQYREMAKKILDALKL